MKISKIVVENYRSIKKVEVEPNKFSIFIGQNNHGKTNFFEAIEWFYNAKSSEDEEHCQKDTGNKIQVEICFDDVSDSDIDKLTTDANKTKIRNILGDATSFSVIKSSSDHKRTYIVNGEDKGNPQGLDTAINEFLPKLEYVNTKIRLDDVSKYKDKNPIGTMLSGVLTAIIETSQDYIDFKETFIKLFDNADSEVRKELDKLGAQVEIYLQKQFPDGTKVKFGVNPPHFTDLLKSFDTSVDDGIETSAKAKGDGMQRAIMLSIIQAFADYRKKQIGGGTFLFMIDEAEKTDGITSIDEVNDLEKINIIFELLGGSPADLLLPRNFLIVEGRCEFEFIKIIIRRFYSDKFNGIKILFAGGDLDEQEPTLLAVHKLFVPLAGSDNPIYKDKAVVLIDKPNTTQQNKYNSFKQGYPYLFDNNQVFELTTESLEEYYPPQYVKTSAEIAQLVTDGKKVEYAKNVAEQITQEQFENYMVVIFQALTKCNECAFNPK